VSETMQYRFVDQFDEELDFPLITDYLEAREYAQEHKLAIQENCYEWVSSDIIDDFRERDEPAEDDITTPDYQRWYQGGKRILFLGPNEDDWRASIRAWMTKENWFPDVWVISDHGNAHRLSMEDE
jgi:hypothetical protein